MATTTFFNDYAANLHRGLVDWPTDPLTIFLLPASPVVTAATSATALSTNRITTNVSSTPGQNGAVTKGTIGTFSINDYRVDLSDTNITADGGTVTFRYAALVTERPAQSPIAVCFWDFADNQVITDGGTATFAYNANGLFTVTVPGSS